MPLVIFSIPHPCAPASAEVELDAPRDAVVLEAVLGVLVRLGGREQGLGRMQPTLRHVPPSFGAGSSSPHAGGLETQLRRADHGDVSPGPAPMTLTSNAWDMKVPFR
jgi:hypothetical protein